MKAQVITGSKQEIAAQVAGIDGEIREAIVFVEDRHTPSGSTEDIFAEMDPLTVRQVGVDDSRDAVYRRMEDE